MTTGKCHVCEKTAEIAYCDLCQHWFCADCRLNIPARVWSAILEKLAGPTPGCCGPES